LAFWLQDISPVYWVWQKLMFVLGGLMLRSRCIRRRPDGGEDDAVPDNAGVAASFVLGPGAVTPLALSLNLLSWSGVTAVGLYECFGERWRRSPSMAVRSSNLAFTGALVGTNVKAQWPSAARLCCRRCSWP
jgi:hypothetical protein